MVYVNQYYEKNLTTSEVTIHYYLGGKQVAYKRGNELRYPLDDHLFSSVGSMDSSGNKVATVRYFPYGGTRFQEGDLGFDKMFTGQRLDDTGLYYYNARYYDATIGRFISPDTVVPNPANPQTWNRYSYCRNNPLKRVDPSGYGDGTKDVFIVVSGSGSAINSAGEWDTMLSAIGYDPSEDWMEFMWDIDPKDGLIDQWDVGPRLAQLLDYLDGIAIDAPVHIIGFSEGACAVGAFLRELADGTGMSGAAAAGVNIRSAILLDPIYGPLKGAGVGDRVSNYDRKWLDNLPGDLAAAGYGHIQLLNVHSEASYCQTGNPKGWGNQARTFDDRSDGQQTWDHWYAGPFWLADKIERGANFGDHHNSVKTHPDSIQWVNETIQATKQ